MVADAHRGDETRTVLATVLMVGLAVHRPRFVEFCRPL